MVGVTVSHVAELGKVGVPTASRQGEMRQKADVPQVEGPTKSLLMVRRHNTRSAHILGIMHSTLL